MGQKRFSLEGGESLIPALDILIEEAANKGVKEFVMGMAHIGRLSTLVNIFGKFYLINRIEMIVNSFNPASHRDGQSFGFNKDGLIKSKKIFENF